MDIEEFFNHQAQHALANYNGNYGFLDFPAISFASWTAADEQLALRNGATEDPLHWRTIEGTLDDARVLSNDDESKLQLWVRHSASNYRAIGKRFVTQEFGLPESIITSKWHFDHAIPRSRNSYVDGVTVMYLIRQKVNTSWGGGYEKKSSTRALNIRGGLTLIALAKVMGVRGPAESRGGWEGVAEELHRLGVRSQMYAQLKTPLTEVERLASELKLCANEPGASLVLSTPKLRSAPTFTADELSHLIQNLPSRINDWFDDDREGERRDAIRGYCETLAGYPHRVSADEVVQFIARKPDLFMLDAIVAKFPNVHSRTGAIGFTVEKSSPFGNLDRFTRLGISDFDM